jgi:hypothetical protein
VKDFERRKSKKYIIMICIVIMISTSAARCELNQILGSGFWRRGEEGLVITKSDENPGDAYLADDTAEGVATGLISSTGQSDHLKPVSFVNYGEFDAVVMPYTYTPLGASSQAPPVHTSTVSSANDGVGDWPNSSRFLSVPMGTYSWCIDWEEGDLDEDGQIDYFHYIQNDPTLLDEEDSDELEFAEEVSVSAPPASGEILEGRCQPSLTESVCHNSNMQVNVQAIYALEQAGRVELYAVPNTAEKTPPEGIDLSHGGNSTGYGNNVILWSAGDFAQASTSNPFTTFGVQIHGDQTIGWARVLFDGQEIWRGDASRYSIAEGRHGVYVEVICVPEGSHLIRIEGLGINGSGGGSSIPVSYFGFGE